MIPRVTGRLYSFTKQSLRSAYIVQGEKPSVMEGDWKPERVVVIEFPSRENANEFLQDPDAQTLFSLRHKTTTSKLVLVDGCLL